MTLALRVLGRGPAAALAALVALVIVFAAVGTLIALAEALAHALPALSYAAWLLSLAPVVLGGALGGERRVAQLSAVAGIFFLALLALLLALALAAAALPSVAADFPRRGCGPLWPRTESATSLSALALVPGIVKYSFAGHESFPSLASTSRAPQRFDRALVPAFAAMLLFTLAFAYVGWYLFGDSPHTSLLLDLPANRFGDAVRVVSAVLLLCGVPVLLLAAFDVLEHDLPALLKANDDEELDDGTEAVDESASLLINEPPAFESASILPPVSAPLFSKANAIRTFVTLLSVGLAIALPDLGLVLVNSFFLSFCILRFIAEKEGEF